VVGGGRAANGSPDDFVMGRENKRETSAWVEWRVNARRCPGMFDLNYQLVICRWRRKYKQGFGMLTCRAPRQLVFGQTQLVVLRRPRPGSQAEDLKHWLSTRIEVGYKELTIDPGSALYSLLLCFGGIPRKDSCKKLKNPAAAIRNGINGI
jgi:hypothetical protein